MKRNTDNMTYTAAILSGGKSTRFSGRNKAKMIIDGKPIIENTINTLKDIFNDIILITNNKDEYSEYKHIRMAGDIYPNIGPWGGIHSALTNSKSEAIFVVAADMPKLFAGMIRYIMNSFEGSEGEVLIPLFKGDIEPLHAVYKRSILKRLEGFIKQDCGYSIREFLKTVDERYIRVDDIVEGSNPFLNINSPEDLDKMNAGNFNHKE